MKGFIWTVESESEFKEIVRQEYRTIAIPPDSEEGFTPFEKEVRYLSVHEKDQVDQAYKNKRTSIQREDVSYYINNYGARGDWSLKDQKDDHLKIAVFGCSFTFGVGIAEDATWVSKIKQKLETDRPIQIINLGFPGGSISKCLKLYKYLTDIYKIDIAIFLLPTHWRDELAEYYTPDYPVAFHNLIPNFNSSYLKDKWEQYYAYSTEGTRFYDVVKNIGYLELISKSCNIENYYSSWDEGLVNFMRDSKLIEKPRLLPYFKFIENMLGPHLSSQYARDGAHPGPASQDLFSTEVVDHLANYSKIKGFSNKPKSRLI